jgi:hypothetical protein
LLLTRLSAEGPRCAPTWTPVLELQSHRGVLHGDCGGGQLRAAGAYFSLVCPLFSFILICPGPVQVVSTSVGGIPEVLPAEMVILTEPTSEGSFLPSHATAHPILLALASGVVAAIPRLASVDRHALHRSVSAMYNWPDVALRVERIYGQMLREAPRTVAERLLEYDFLSLTKQ